MKKAFTLLELVFVIVVIGILSAAILPRVSSDKLQECATQLVSDIRYTQHLAMLNDKYNPNNPEWYKERWELIFGTSDYTNNKIAYSIFSDKDSGSGYDGKVNLNELALDPLDSSKYFSGGYSGVLYTSDSRANKKLNIGESYGITSISFEDGCSNISKRISFDNLGRPIVRPLDSYTKSYKKDRLLKSTCSIILSNLNDSITIKIEANSGFSYIK